MSSSTGLGHHQAAFQNTLWSQVFAAGELNAPNSAQALEELCKLYWFPIYAFLRRWGHDRQQARDLAQGFFVYLLEQNAIARADPDRGRFRSFLLGILKNYVSNQQNWANAIKRGGQQNVVSIDEETAEGLYANEPVTNASPDNLYERQWALTVLEEAMRRLRLEYQRAKMEGMFEILHPWLTGEQESGYGVLAAKMHKTENNARQIVLRFRNRFRQAIRGVIADTVSDADLVEIELNHLQAALRGE